VNGALTTLRAAASFAAVIALLAVFVWALRRGSLRLSALAPRGTIAIETAMSLGERRSLAIVTVEGRRMLVGMTPASISLLTDLPPSAAQAPGWPSSPPPSSEPTRAPRATPSPERR
jgi:flagellar protein FliO/FliZ